jgi:hypothetical protein
MLTYDDDTETFVLPSGRTMSANCGILGIGPDLDLFEGYDARLRYDDAPYELQFSPEDAEAIADHAIERWQAFKKRARQS